MTLFDRSEFENAEFDFSRIRPTKQEIASLFEDISSLPQVSDFIYSFSLQEAKITIDTSTEIEGQSLVDILPDDVKIPYASVDSEDEEAVSLDIELADWFRFEDDTIFEQYDVTPPTDSQLKETAAFVQATTEQIDSVESSRAVEIEDGEYGVILTFKDSAEITDTYILNQLREWVGFSYGGFVVTNGTFDCIIVTLTQKTPFQISDCDGFRMQQLQMYEEEAIENKLIAKLPCGHSSSITSVLFTHHSGEFDEFNLIEWDDCEMRIVPISEDEGGLVRVDSDYDGGFIPVKTAHSMVCSECSTAYVINDFDSFKQSVCSVPRFEQIVGYGPDSNEFSFMFPQIEPVEREYISSNPVSVTDSEFEWLLKRSYDEK